MRFQPADCPLNGSPYIEQYTHNDPEPPGRLTFERLRCDDDARIVTKGGARQRPLNKRTWPLALFTHTAK